MRTGYIAGAWLPLMLFVVAISGGAAVAAADGGRSAIWEPKELEFDYLGMTSYYSCDGLRGRVTQALIDLGAAPGLAVEPHACANGGGVERFPELRIRMSTLRPVADAATPGAVAAHWSRVRLAGPGRLEPGDCELAEQIRDRILPLFTTRNLQARLTCVPHQEPGGNIALSVDVLVPDQPRQR